MKRYQRPLATLIHLYTEPVLTNPSTTLSTKSVESSEPQLTNELFGRRNSSLWDEE